jgi:hypothetical protein
VGEPEGSLQASQEALLWRDVARLEGCTREQSRLRRSLEILGSQDAGHSERIDSAEPVPQQQPDLLPADLHPSDLRQYDLPLGDLALAAELRSAQLRVLHLGLVPAALLIWAQR